MKKDSLFFDVHMHAFNLSHAGLLAFINRALLDNDLTMEDLYEKNYPKFFKLGLKLAGSRIWSWLSSPFKKKEKNGGSLERLVNTLSVFENDIARQFLYIEQDYLLMCENDNLKKLIINVTPPVNYRELYIKLNQEWINSGQKFTIGKMVYNAVVLIPLMMDFNNKGFSGLPPKKIHYHLPPTKSIKDQSIDLFTGIYQYYKISNIQLFEIYPFMALNTENLEFGDEEIRYETKSMRELLDQHFGDFNGSDTGEERYKKLSEKLNLYKNTVEDGWFNPLDSRCYYFAGIKVYPPLGFDPWPDKSDPESQQNFKKANYFYSFCVEKGVPITSHCSNGGFKVAKLEDAATFTHPKRWEQVLKNYPLLRLNFAHDGIHDSDKVENEWSKKILEYVLNYDNVYFDIADNVYEKEYFTRLFNFISKQKYNPDQLNKISSRILFGTDFMMLLLGTNSYYEYLVDFSGTNAFENQFVDKHTMCNKNSFEFIFGK
jgi:hypothetical protein